MTPLIIVLTWSLTCAPVHEARSYGYTDAQIEQAARDRHVPEWIINWAKKRCKAPQTVDTSMTQR